MFGIVLTWLLLAIGVGMLASRYNRSGPGWFLFSILLSPLIGFVFVLAAGPDNTSQPTPLPKSETENIDASIADYLETTDAMLAKVKEALRVEGTSKDGAIKLIASLEKVAEKLTDAVSIAKDPSMSARAESRRERVSDLIASLQNKYGIDF